MCQRPLLAQSGHLIFALPGHLNLALTVSEVSARFCGCRAVSDSFPRRDRKKPPLIILCTCIAMLPDMPGGVLSEIIQQEHHFQAFTFPESWL